MEIFVENNLRLLNLEREVEKEENRLLIENVSPKELQKRGVCLLNLRISARKSGMFGRTLVMFSPFWSDKQLPSHSLTPGDILALSPSHGDNTIEVTGTGVVTLVRADGITVAFDDVSCAAVFDLSDADKWKLVKLANDITYKRLRRALEKLRDYRTGTSCRLIEALIGAANTRAPLDIANYIVFMNEGLNDIQREAVKFALNQPDVAVIHGPPGTGKTTTLIEIIHHAVRLNMKVLACAPSNVAVDNLVTRLAAGGVIKLVRLGHPARVHADIQRYSLDAIVAGSEEKQLARDVRTNIEETMAKLRTCRGAGEKQALRQEMKYLRKELVRREETATREILKKADVVLATLTSSSDDGPIRLLDTDNGFDLVVIDECSQAMEASCWIALLQGKRCILAGDHQQLPPTIISKQAASEGLERTLMERVIEEHGGQVVRMLTIQYRMHASIMKWPSQQLYNGLLEAHPSVATHLLKDLPNVDDTDDTNIPLLLLDTTGCNLPELVLQDHVSKGNEGEADLVDIHVRALMDAGVGAEDIAVIAPYNLQVELIRKRLGREFPKLEIKSVDSFQGREKEAVVISLVRSNDKGEVGFLSENRRINVALTRARRHLAVIADTNTVSHHPFLKSLVEFMSTEGEVRTAHQYQQEHQIGRLTVDAASVSKSAPKTKAKPKAKSEKKLDAGAAGNDRKGNDWEEVKRVSASFPHVKKIVHTFMTDVHAHEYQFSTALTKAERKYVHEVCEDLGLCHESYGEESQRYIVISKRKSDGDPGALCLVDHGGNKAAPRSSTPVKIGNDRGADHSSIATPPATDHSSITTPPATDHSSITTPPATDHSSITTPPATDHSAITTVPVTDHSAITPAVDTITESTADGAASVVNIASVTPLPSEICPVEMNKNQRPCLPPATKSTTLLNSSVSVANCCEKNVKSFPNSVECENCHHQIPIANLELHKIRCQEKDGASQSKSTNANIKTVRPKSSQPKEKPKKKDRLQKTSALEKINVKDDDDFDALLAAAQHQDNVCNYVRCKTSTVLIGQHCTFCARRYCLTHYIAEVHGCGDAAKLEARRTVVREGRLYPGSGVPSKKPDATVRAHLHRKLEKTIGEKEAQRKIKKK